ncbi:type 1 glutamine amidotransferase [Sulfuritalea sp.]|uniref:type 1 glutamine amidotransferase n=1 Tax=Sulfuritalea sp. TaxID=2480090 RepID=UPI00286D9C9E|nr:type 1 glutamine amidotransferase [Sulfuritalea sp.]
MKPIAIFRHSPGEGPGYFATFLDRHSLPWTLFRIDEGVAPPPTPDEFSGLCLMGGPMSVNDELAWIPQELELIRAADRLGIPVIGHCLGGQLMASAFGGTVGRNPVKEIGWGRVAVTPAAAQLAVDWLGDSAGFEAFHWHGEAFSIPPGATRILGNAHCANQAFVRGPHLGMQCHVEMTETMIRSWCQQWAAEGVPPSASVQTPQQMLTDMEPRIAAMRAVADRLYAHWIGGLRED